MSNTSKNRLIIALVLILLVSLVLFYHFKEKEKKEIAFAENQYKVPIASRLELVYQDKTAHQHALELCNFVKNEIEAGTYRDLSSPKLKNKERRVQNLFKAARNNAPYKLYPESDYGRGSVDFILNYAGDEAQIEVKIAPNVKKNLKAQVETYSKANGINKTVIAIVHFNDKQYAKAKAIVDKLAFDENTQVVYINANSTDKNSGSRAVA